MVPVNSDRPTLMNSGHLGCPGCGATIAMKFALDALGKNTMVILPASCWGIISGPFPMSSLNVPIMQTAFATGGAAASGLRAALEMTGRKDVTVLSWAGDGGTFDIGFQSLSGAVERNEDCIFVCYDNEAYMNTGVQRSSATPFGMRTTTTPGEGWKRTRKKNMVAALAAHRIPYAATASIGFPDDMIAKFKKAGALRGGARFIHVLATCPTGWGISSGDSVKLARLAVQTNVFPLYEVLDGIHYTLNYRGSRPVEDYLKAQGRFKHLTEADCRTAQEMVSDDWQLLLKKAADAGPALQNESGVL